MSSPGFIKDTLSNGKTMKRKFSSVITNQVFNKLDVNSLNNTLVYGDANNCSVLSANSNKSDTSFYFDCDATFDVSLFCLLLEVFLVGGDEIILFFKFRIQLMRKW